MMSGGGVLATVVSVPLGAAAGTGIRMLLSTLRRGVVLRPGVPEVAAALVTGVGTALAGGQKTLGLLLLAGLLMVALGAVDIVHHRLPDAITVTALPVAALAVLLTKELGPRSGSLVGAAAAAVVLWALFALTARLAPRSMGWGDVKLIPTLGLLMGYLSPVAVLTGLLLAFGTGSIVALAGMAVRRLQLGSAIPLGPYLLFGCWTVLLFPHAFVATG